MKISIFAFIVVVAFVATCAFYGWLESAVNMAEGLRQLFAPGATTVLFSPILLLFILLSLGVFIGGPLLATGVAAVFGGLLIRSQALTASRSFARWFALAGFLCQFAIIFFAIEQNSFFLRKRPQVHPQTSALVLAFLAGANTALDLFVAALIVRKLHTRATRNPG